MKFSAYIDLYVMNFIAYGDYGTKNDVWKALTKTCTTIKKKKKNMESVLRNWENFQSLRKMSYVF